MITFQQNGLSPSGKTKKWLIFGPDGSSLGTVGWFGAWRKYAAQIEGIFDHKCLREIADFCEKETREHKQ